MKDLLTAVNSDRQLRVNVNRVIQRGKIREVQNLLWKYPDLYRDTETLQMVAYNNYHKNIFHYAIIQEVPEKQGRVDIDVLKLLIEHEVNYCKDHSGKEV